MTITILFTPVEGSDLICFWLVIQAVERANSYDLQPLFALDQSSRQGLVRHQQV